MVFGVLHHDHGRDTVPFSGQCHDAGFDEETVDSNVIMLVRSIAKAQCAATCVAFGGLIALGKFSPSTLGSADSWAAVNIMLCAALGLAALSAYIIVLPMIAEPEADAPDTTTAPVVSVKPKPQGQKAGHKPVRTFGRATRPA